MRTVKNGNATCVCEVYKTIGGHRVRGTFHAYKHSRKFDVKLHDDMSFYIGHGGSGSSRFVWVEG